MDVRTLRYFLAVYDEKSISAAAKSCCVAQPSISAAVKGLETHLNCQLFIRHKKGVVATDEAQRLEPLARKLCSDLSAISNLFQKAEVRRPFRLGLIRALGAERMGYFLKEFTNRVEGIELTLVEPEAPCDARIITRKYLTEHEKFIPLWHDDYLLAVPEEHPFALKKDISVRELQGLAFIYRSPCEALDDLLYALDSEQIALDIRARIHTLEYALALVSAGVGCALIPSIPSLLDQKGTRHLPINDMDLSRGIGLAYRESNSGTSSLNALIQVCKEESARYV